ncbi:tRNA (uridine(34)/cytosine(34)/5-carboxymethylaminomethyluridine(34)-2'-O)-methyltransferase TrmL [Thioflexithrix psekupsensis]|uniref:tRNA (cytidine(34)-2'-O)-methyltransferase n=1 Tax=Thioflexithrix psekupsensis TaxID=1570016 RepID=A0A251XAP2_9GAMM|nr:tRNA (uridine(34)/cytosine(34)/5-carboxymethylaminomethyluridine(34)-2'-O)-methyltransferase TrmL [Thioflexithrix psekupsensis]OUD15501.1 tRNA (uridine(34)/cytosine(34)/5-carboxymethylaminomethyluridine(34)-2'-O)-methyltransferase TrmL [Thioflexithrix psekupsensis]
MFHCILYQPEIPPNTGNIIRLCANAGFTLHVIEPLGFVWDDKRLKRAGLDYHEWARVRHHANLSACLVQLSESRIFACSTKSETNYSQINYRAQDAFLFGPETRGLPLDVLHQFHTEQRIRIPMQANSRSLNLSNSVAIILYEAWRQVGFC